MVGNKLYDFIFIVLFFGVVVNFVEVVIKNFDKYVDEYELEKYYEGKEDCRIENGIDVD